MIEFQEELGVKRVLVISILLFTYCSCSAERFIPEDIEDIFNAENTSDPPYYIDDLMSIFSQEQVVWINANSVYLRRYLPKKIDEGSIIAIKLAGALKVQMALPSLKKRLLTLEGLIGSKAIKHVIIFEKEDWLSDKFFPHHSLCIKAMEKISGAPLREAVNLTTLERHHLEILASVAVLPKSKEDIGDKNINDSTWCARWLLMKLDISE